MTRIVALATAWLPVGAVLVVKGQTADAIEYTARLYDG